MGLLGDAIREHLELSRRHGADPSEVNRKELEAFGSSASMDIDMAPPGHKESGGGTSPRISTKRVFDRLDHSDPHTSDDTVELDMETVLEGIAIDRAHPSHAPSAAVRVTAGLSR